MLGSVGLTELVVATILLAIPVLAWFLFYKD